MSMPRNVFAARAIGFLRKEYAKSEFDLEAPMIGSLAFGNDLSRIGLNGLALPSSITTVGLPKNCFDATLRISFV